MPRNSGKSVPWVGRQDRVNTMDRKHYFSEALDDRTVTLAGNRPRVSFKTQIRPGREKSRNFEVAVRHHLDDDVSMGLGSNNNGRPNIFRGGRIRGMPRGRNSPVPRRGMRGTYLYRPRRFITDDAAWYKIIIPYGHKYNKDYLLKTLQGYIAPDTFIPMMYKVGENDAVFYVDDFKTAEKLEGCDRKITLNNGFKLFLKVRPGFPQCDVDEALKERMKQALSKRYKNESNSLDLSRFHQDPALVEDCFCALFRPVMLMTVLDIVAEHIPNLEALNLDNNKLSIIERLSVLGQKFPKLKILHIGDNRIMKMREIDVLKNLNLEEFRLEGNPLCKEYKERQDEYVSDVRQRFPKLLKLDGIELPRPILFDVADGVKLPPIQRVFNPNAQEYVGQFLQQYFAVFDSDDRQPLLQAYHEQASFSLTVSYGSNANRSSEYLSENRNLYSVHDTDRRRKLLKLGRLPVVSFISQMPKTNHDSSSYTMDLSLATETMTLLTVTGIFKEVSGSKQEPLRYFNRTILLVPQGAGYCILNEQLHISQPTEAQTKQAFATIVESLPPVTSAPAEETKQLMALELCRQTNMNMTWSLKCLEDVHWNYDNALSAFQECYNAGRIPAEAFEK